MKLAVEVLDIGMIGLLHTESSGGIHSVRTSPECSGSRQDMSCTLRSP